MRSTICDLLCGVLFMGECAVLLYLPTILSVFME